MRSGCSMETAEAGRAITPDGIFKQVRLRRRIKPAGSVELSLGREGLARMRAAKQKEQNEVRAGEVTVSSLRMRCNARGVSPNVASPVPGDHKGERGARPTLSALQPRPQRRSSPP
jgi:hypothetical protein